MEGQSMIVDNKPARFMPVVKEELIFLVPSFLTSTRIILTSVLITSLMEGGWGFPVFALACLTDVLDGALARQMHSESKFGGLLDASADFFLVFSTSTFFVWNGLVSFWFLCLISVAFIRFLFFNDASRSDPLGKHIGTVLFITLGVILIFPVLSMATWTIAVASCYIVASMLCTCKRTL